jgi:DNA (cytosine-5)-methyltransferase 1
MVANSRTNGKEPGAPKMAQPDNTRPALISLFCGPGGFDQGFKDVGFMTRLAYDVDDACVKTHRHNHPEAWAQIVDLSSIQVKDIIEEWCRRSPNKAPLGVIGGPPCQSFSVSNVFQTDDDPRHHLPEHYARILGGLNAAFGIDFFVFENVPGLVTRKHAEKFARFKDLFREAGFEVFEGSLDAQNFGVAQERRRVFIVGINRTKFDGFQFAFPRSEDTEPLTVEHTIGNLPDPVYFARGVEGGKPHINHWCMAPKSDKFTNGDMTPGVIMGRSFRVLAWDRPSYTVAYGHREVHVHPSGKRRLSVYEAMLLQGFPPDYELKGTLSDQIRLVSEAVAPPVARALAEALNKQLRLGLLPQDLVQAELELAQAE